jgi:GNAT superfamily N-acetyltransferase
VTDRATFAWLCDVFVLEAYRAEGLSKWLIESVMSQPVLRSLCRVLLGTRDAHGLYERYGFTPLANPPRFMEVFQPDVYRADLGSSQVRLSLSGQFGPGQIGQLSGCK